MLAAVRAARDYRLALTARAQLPAAATAVFPRTASPPQPAVHDAPAEPWQRPWAQEKLPRPAQPHPQSTFDQAQRQSQRQSQHCQPPPPTSSKDTGPESAHQTTPNQPTATPRTLTRLQADFDELSAGLSPSQRASIEAELLALAPPQPQPSSSSSSSIWGSSHHPPASFSAEEPDRPGLGEADPAPRVAPSEFAAQSAGQSSGVGSGGAEWGPGGRSSWAGQLAATDDPDEDHRGAFGWDDGHGGSSGNPRATRPEQAEARQDPGPPSSSGYPALTRQPASPVLRRQSSGDPPIGSRIPLGSNDPASPPVSRHVPAPSERPALSPIVKLAQARSEAERILRQRAEVSVHSEWTKRSELDGQLSAVRTQAEREREDGRWQPPASTISAAGEAPELVADLARLTALRGNGGHAQAEAASPKRSVTTFSPNGIHTPVQVRQPHPLITPRAQPSNLTGRTATSPVGSGAPSP